jgi:hypothetical protein
MYLVKNNQEGYAKRVAEVDARGCPRYPEEMLFSPTGGARGGK